MRIGGTSIPVVQSPELKGERSMPLSKKLRTILIAFACLTLVAFTVAAMTGAPDAATTSATPAASAEEPPCSGNCETCPHAGSEGCHERAAADEVDAGPDATVDPERCIGCARCVNVAPEAFRMNSDTGKAEVIEGASEECIECGARACPVDAISG
jgi:ferredoxin